MGNRRLPTPFPGPRPRSAPRVLPPRQAESDDAVRGLEGLDAAAMDFLLDFGILAMTATVLATILALWPRQRQDLQGKVVLVRTRRTADGAPPPSTSTTLGGTRRDFRVPCNVVRVTT